jgi:hypothetical protein
MPGQRFIDRLIADTLSERYRPCKESGDMLDTCEAVEDAMRAWQKVLKTGDETVEVESCESDSACLRSPLGRLCDWFAGLFSVDAVAMPID